ncbi:MAG: UvrD-helicase domain-containing protein [Desulfovibrionaceae bacterium]|nr:UvrD-helicase domain-containing protein [Desulfovibrionaceae bacterium]
MAKLNEQQIRAASFTDGVAVVIAVPGSGKTLTMTHRIGRLVNSGVSPESILGLTFTRNAANEMRSRLVDVLKEEAPRVMLSTIHSFCHHILRCEGVLFDILEGKDRLMFIRKIMGKLGVKDISVGMVLKEIALAKNNLVVVEEFFELHDGDKAMLKVAEVFQVYEDDKKKKMLKDFDDLLLDALDLPDFFGPLNS